MENLLSVEEAARRLGGISKWTLHAWLSKGRLQRTKVGGRTMIRESAVLVAAKPNQRRQGAGGRFHHDNVTGWLNGRIALQVQAEMPSIFRSRAINLTKGAMHQWTEEVSCHSDV